MVQSVVDFTQKKGIERFAPALFKWQLFHIIINAGMCFIYLKINLLFDLMLYVDMGSICYQIKNNYREILKLIIKTNSMQ
jgi:hypothetical protein